MARETDCLDDQHYGSVWADKLERFANLIAASERENAAINGIHTCHSKCQRPICVAVREAVAAEREACAKVAETVTPRHTECGNKIAFAIRERGAP
jgi:hypothetical protein